MTRTSARFKVAVATMLVAICLVVAVPDVHAAPGGGTWFTNDAVVLWENRVDAWTDEFEPGYPEWINKHVDTFRFRAETVVQDDSIVNVTGAYYYKAGTITQAPNYQNDPSFIPWHQNTSYIINASQNTQFHGYWNAKNASMTNLPAQLDFVDSGDIVNGSAVGVDPNGQIFSGTLLLTESLLWTFGQEFETNEGPSDEVFWTSSLVIPYKTDRRLNYTLTVTKHVRYNGTYPSEPNAWQNSTFQARGGLLYGKTTNVLINQRTQIEYTLVAFNNDTKVHDTSTKAFRQYLQCKFPSAVYEDIDLGELVDGYVPVIAGLAALAAILLVARRVKRAVPVA